MVINLKKRVMVVLSNHSEAIRMKEAFERIGIESCAVNSGFAAKEMAAKEFFDIIICDALLPDVTGRELIEEMCFVSPESKVLLVDRPANDPEAINDLINSELFETLFKQGSVFNKVYPGN